MNTRGLFVSVTSRQLVGKLVEIVNEEIRGNGIEVKIRARNISLQAEDGHSVAMMLLLIMILPTIVRSE